MISRQSVFAFALSAVAFAAAGCYKEKSIDGLVPLCGNVQYDGKPVENASILLLPKYRDENGKGAVATSDAQGNFKAMTVLPGDGVLPGTYTVTVQKIEYQEAAPSAKPVDPDDRNYVPEARPYIVMLPEKYGDERTTDLEITVPPEGNKKWEIQLTGPVDLTPKRPNPRSGPGGR